MAASNVFRWDNVVRMGILWTFVLILSYVRLWFRSWKQRSSPQTSVSLMPIGKMKPACIVTGASSGIGRATATALAQQGYHVILAGKSLGRIQTVIDELEHRHSDLSLQGMELDLSNISSIFDFVQAVNTWLQTANPPHSLDLLINNAGILAASQRWSPDGFDYMMACNYFGPFILVTLLVPILQTSSSNPRIVNVVSFTHHCVESFQIEPALLAQGRMQGLPNSTWYRMARIYETSKFCMVLLTYELHSRLFTAAKYSKISVMAADPGAVKTDILREVPGWLRVLSQYVLGFLRLLSSPAVGSAAVVDAALAPEGRSGEYFFGGNGRTVPSSGLSHNQSLAAKLWQETSDLCLAAISKYSTGPNIIALHIQDMWTDPKEPRAH